MFHSEAAAVHENIDRRTGTWHQSRQSTFEMNPEFPFLTKLPGVVFAIPDKRQLTE
jgi:hypothetical protein